MLLIVSRRKGYIAARIRIIMAASRRLTDQQAFGLVVRSRRERLDLSQEALASVIGIHRTYVGSVERGERNISLKNIHAFARSLRTTASSLLAEAESMT